MSRLCVLVSLRGHILVFVSLLCFYSTYFHGPVMILDLSMFLLFGCCGLLFQFHFVLIYFLHFIGHSLVLPICPFLLRLSAIAFFLLFFRSSLFLSQASSLPKCSHGEPARQRHPDHPGDGSRRTRHVGRRIRRRFPSNLSLSGLARTASARNPRSHGTAIGSVRVPRCIGGEAPTSRVLLVLKA